jgi:hypothetical protein
MSTPTSTNADRLASLPKPSLTPEGRVWLHDLPLPPELVPELEYQCQRYWFWQRAKYRRFHEDELKLQWYFGGHLIYYLWAPTGIAVVSVGGPTGEGAFHRFRDQLPVAERDQLRSEYVFPWNDDVSLCPAMWEVP